MIIYHIVLPEVWEHFKTRPSYQAESLTTEGFIHCSYDHQLEAVLKRYYKDAERVIILSINTEKVLAKLVEEPSTGGEIYPHIYGRLNHNAITSAEERELVTTR
jgi:uncharacterized protein (DUF952 family)